MKSKFEVGQRFKVSCGEEKGDIIEIIGVYISGCDYKTIKSKREKRVDKITWFSHTSIFSRILELLNNDCNVSNKTTV